MGAYTSPKVERRESKTGWGIFAIETISKGELLVDFTEGQGRLIDVEEASRLYEQGFDDMIQVADDKYVASTLQEELEDADMVNHSCVPNCGMQGNYKIVALRDVEPGEEITFDYAMVENSDWEMECLCGYQSCRGVITGSDWRQDELQRKYQGYFSDYIAGKIESL